MFEKEAEDYAEKKICQEYNGGCTGFYRCKEYCERYHITQKHWKDGAEFGYNRGFEAGRKEATQRLKNCLNCEKRRTCKTWHLVCGLEAANTANYNCVCLDKWEIAEECEEEK